MEETVILYESPHRLVKTLTKMAEIIGGDRQIAIVKELTKIHALTFRGTLSESLSFFNEENTKGEFVLILHGVNA